MKQLLVMDNAQCRLLILHISLHCRLLNLRTAVTLVRQFATAATLTSFVSNHKNALIVILYVTVSTTVASMIDLTRRVALVSLTSYLFAAAAAAELLICITRC
jgi:hypothetical protein